MIATLQIGTKRGHLAALLERNADLRAHIGEQRLAMGGVNAASEEDAAV